jgi:hypothetical protein
MDFSAEIATLELERQKEIAEMRFDKARELASHINAFRESYSAFYSASTRSSAKSKFESAKQESIAELMMTSSNLTRKIYSIRAAHQSSLAQARRLQAEELSALSAELAKKLELTATRSIPQANALLRIAQINAHASRYEDAHAIAEDAQRLRADVIAERHSQLHEHYSARQEKLTAKHRASDAQFDAKLAVDLQEVHTEHKKALAFHKQRMLASAFRCGVTVTEAEVDEMFANCVLRDDQTLPPEPSPKDRGRGPRFDQANEPCARTPKKATPRKYRSPA